MKDIMSRIETKKLIKIGMIAIIVIVCIIGFSLIYYNFFYQRSYQEIEEIMVDAAKHYYADNEDKLPKITGEIKSISTETLTENDYMKSITEYLKNEDIACKASVNITKLNNKYRFNPLLDCGRYYKYEFITDKIKKTEKIVNEEDGLYQINEELVFKGEKIKNYVEFANTNWRIIKIKNNKLTLIYNGEKLDNITWDDRYNKERQSNTGINDYKVSRIKEYLNNLYKGNKLFKINDKLLISNSSLEIGKIGENDDDRNGTLSKSNILDNQYIGLITISDFMNASLDKNCTYATNLSCSNYNYLTDYDYKYWMITADKNTTHKVFRFDNYDNISLKNASSSGYIRPVITIVSDAIYVKGNGSAKNPYIFK